MHHYVLIEECLACAQNFLFNILFLSAIKDKKLDVLLIFIIHSISRIFGKIMFLKLHKCFPSYPKIILNTDLWKTSESQAEVRYLYIFLFTKIFTKTVIHWGHWYHFWNSIGGYKNISNSKVIDLAQLNLLKKPILFICGTWNFPSFL